MIGKNGTAKSLSHTQHRNRFRGDSEGNSIPGAEKKALHIQHIGDLLTGAHERIILIASFDFITLYNLIASHPPPPPSCFLLQMHAHTHPPPHARPPTHSTPTDARGVVCFIQALQKQPENSQKCLSKQWGGARAREQASSRSRQECSTPANRE